MKRRNRRRLTLLIWVWYRTSTWLSWRQQSHGHGKQTPWRSLANEKSSRTEVKTAGFESPTERLTERINSSAGVSGWNGNSAGFGSEAERGRRGSSVPTNMNPKPSAPGPAAREAAVCFDLLHPGSPHKRCIGAFGKQASSCSPRMHLGQREVGLLLRLKKANATLPPSSSCACLSPAKCSA